MAEALVTIGLPIYNGASLCPIAIESVLAQTYPDFELLISDNCSTDETEEICRGYAQRDSRIRYTKTERNLGAAGNYRRTVELARGQYFRWLAHDDSIHPDFIRECLPVAEADPEIISVVPVMDIMDSAGIKHQSVVSYTGRTRWSSNRIEQYAQMMEELAYCETHSDGLIMVAYMFALHRLSLLRRTRLIMPFISSDFVLAAELALWGKLAFVNKPLGAFVSDTGTLRHVLSWNPLELQRMLDPSRISKLDLLISVRRRHFEHIVAVLRSPLSMFEKVPAVELATRPMRARFRNRFVAASEPVRLS
jgi:glycosyltransferase involved in cell wall biosynthesis